MTHSLSRLLMKILLTSWRVNQWEAGHDRYSLQLLLESVDLGLNICLFLVDGRVWLVLLYQGVKTAGDDVEECCNAGNRIALINKLFNRFDVKLCGIMFTAHGYFSFKSSQWF